MKINNINKIFGLAVVAVVSLASCNKYLDKLPDDRAELNSVNKVKMLLVDAYPAATTNLLLEVSSDNVTDNGSAHSTSEIMEKIYKFQDNLPEATDGPSDVWDGFYKAVGVCNQSLQALDELGVGNCPERAEAQICRAYSMFTLANCFCMAWNPEKADEYLGLAYPTKPQTSVHETYQRGTLRELYKKINDDIEAALPYLDDNNYTQPKYHFNKKAAYAFAARFNLFYMNYDKAIKYANEVLGNNPKAVMRDYLPYTTIGRVDMGNLWIRSTESANLLLMTAYSTAGRNLCGLSSPRFHHNSDMASYETYWPDMPWGSGSSNNTLYYSHNLYGTNEGVAFPKLDEQFEYTDKVNYIGYPHIVDPVFTGDETLLVRAEAYALRNKDNDAQKSIDDINIWIETHCYDVYEYVDDKSGKKSYTYRPIMTLDASDRNQNKHNINDVWNSIDYAPVVLEGRRDRSIRKKFNPQGFTIDGVINGEFPDGDFIASTQENLLQMILHMRRMEMLFQGDRFIYIKRYGIEFCHLVAGKDPVVFYAGDLRGAIQLPTDVIGAGQTPNPR